MPNLEKSKEPDSIGISGDIPSVIYQKYAVRQVNSYASVCLCANVRLRFKNNVLSITLIC